MKTFKTFMAEKKLSQKDIKRALASIKPPKKKPTLPKAPWDDKEQKEAKVDEVLDRPGALDSYRKKADASGNKARNSATRKILTAPKDGKRPDHSDELKTMRKRNKGQDMADRVAAKQFRKSIGLGYNSKKENVNEISIGKLSRYAKAAAKDVETHRDKVTRIATQRNLSAKDNEAGMAAINKLGRRSKGSNMYVDKMSGRSKVKPTAEETVDEISNAKMGQYVRKATDDAARRAMDAGEKAGRGDSKGFGKQIVKSRQRVKGVQKAMDKMDKNRLYGRQ